MGILNELITYSNAVLDGKIITCQKHRWACLRFLDDLKRRGEWEWDFDEAKAERYFQWMRLFKHRKGVLAGQTKEPCDYELFVYSNIYGWLNASGDRRFRYTYEQLARKQAKSQNKAIQALYEMSVFGEPSAEVYVAATQKSQTRYVWEEAEWLINNSILKDKFISKYDAAYEQRVIKHIKSGSIFARMSKDDKKKGDGANPHFGIIDEYHLHDTTEFYDLLDSGMITRRNPLLSIITTAGFELNNPCYRVTYKFVSNLLNPDSPIEDDRYFAIVCELDRNETTEIIITPNGRQIEPWGIIDEIGTDEAIIKTNPVTGTSPVARGNILTKTAQAQNIPENMRGLWTKTYNVWIQSREQGYMDMARWGACKVPASELLNLIKEKAAGRCYVGFDLSSKIDLTAVSWIFPWIENFIRNYAIISHAFIPEEKFHERMRTDHVPYDLWRNNGYITVTPGAVVDYRYVLEYVFNTSLANEWNPVEYCLDPWGSTAIANDLMDNGKTVVEIIQGIKTLSEPTKHFRESVYAQQLHHDGNPVLAWAVGNAVTRQDHNQNIMLDKDKSTLRIDPAAASITGLTRAMVADIAPKEINLEDLFDFI